VSVLKTLLDHGADPNIALSDYGSLFSDVSHPVKGHDADTEFEAMHLLLQRGTNPFPWDEDTTLPPGRVDPNIDALVKEAKAIETSKGCPPDPTAQEQAVCLPNMLHRADADLTERYTAALKSAGASTPRLRREQNAWIRERNQHCGLHKLSGVSKGGWMAYVLADPSRAVCTIDLTLERATSYLPSTPPSTSTPRSRGMPAP